MGSPKKTQPTPTELWPAGTATRPELRIISLSIKNVLGIEERAISPEGRAVIARGPNGTGKTSVVDAVRATLGGGPLHNIVRVGPDGKPAGEPELVMVLEGGGKHFRIQKVGSGTAKVFERVGETAADEEKGRPQEWLNSLYDPTCANPVTLLMAAEKDLATLILESLDLDLDEAALAKVVAPVADLVPAPKIPAGLHALLHVEMVRDAVYNARTGVNVSREGKDKASQQTLLQTPAVIADDPAEQIAAGEREVAILAEAIAAKEGAVLAEERRALEAARADDDLETGKVRASFQQAKAKLEADHAREAAELRARVEEEIAQRRGAMEAAINGLRESDQGKLDEIQGKRDAADNAAHEARETSEIDIRRKRAELAQARDSLAQLRGIAEARIGHVRTRELADQFAAEGKALREDSERLTRTLDAIDTFRRGLATSLPVEGLEISGRAVTINGVPWRQLNTAQRVTAAARIALARASKNPLKALFLDNLESLDTPHRTALLEFLVTNGAQVFGAQVTDGDPEVVYVGAQVA